MKATSSYDVSGRCTAARGGFSDRALNDVQAMLNWRMGWGSSWAWVQDDAQAPPAMLRPVRLYARWPAAGLCAGAHMGQVAHKCAAAEPRWQCQNFYMILCNRSSTGFARWRMSSARADCRVAAPSRQSEPASSRLKVACGWPLRQA